MDHIRKITTQVNDVTTLDRSKKQLKAHLKN